MNKKEELNKFKIKEYLMALLFILVFIGALLITNAVMRGKNTRYKYNDFFKEKNGYDVLFFGSSHMELFVSPLELWNRYGITSYNFGNPEEGFRVTYWLAANAIECYKPKAIVVDMHMFGFGDEYVKTGHVHYALDTFPNNKTKYLAVNDLIEDKNARIEMYFPLGYYHSRWIELNEEDVRNNSKYMKGNYSYGYYKVPESNPFKQYDIETEIYPDMDDSWADVRYLQKFIDLCEENNIELLLVCNPYICPPGKQQVINYGERYAKDRNIPFINLVKEGNVVDYDVDMYDEGHVNMMGMHKVTTYIGDYLINNYSFTDHRNDANYDSWNVAYNDYMNLKYECMMWEDDITRTLVLMNDKDVDVKLYMRDENTSVLSNVNEKLYMDIERFDDPCEAYPEIDKDSYDLIFEIFDEKTGELKLVKTFTSDGDGYITENHYNDFPFKYMF